MIPQKGYLKSYNNYMLDIVFHQNKWEIMLLLAEKKDSSVFISAINKWNYIFVFCLGTPSIFHRYESFSSIKYNNNRQKLMQSM